MRSRRRTKIAGNFKDFINRKYILLLVHFREMTNRNTNTKQDDGFTLVLISRKIKNKSIVYCRRFPSRDSVMYINIHIAYIHTYIRTYMYINIYIFLG